MNRMDDESNEGRNDRGEMQQLLVEKIIRNKMVKRVYKSGVDPVGTRGRLLIKWENMTLRRMKSVGVKCMDRNKPQSGSDFNISFIQFFNMIPNLYSINIQYKNKNNNVHN